MKSILVVDDDTLFLQSVKRGLCALHDDFNVYIAENGYEAVWVMGRVDIDLMITDLRMPNMDGFELIRSANAFHKDVIVIAMTAFCEPGAENMLKKMGVKACLDKPLDIDELEAAVTASFTMSGAAA